MLSFLETVNPILKWSECGLGRWQRVKENRRNKKERIEMVFLKHVSQNYRQKVEWWLLGAEGGRENKELLNGYRGSVLQE